MIARAWTEADIPKIVEIEKVCFSDPWTVEAFESGMSNPFFHSVLLEDGGQVCGYGCLIVLFEDAELANIAVAPIHRGKGAGKALMESMHEKAKALGAERMLLEVRVSNTNAIGLYEKYGYQRYGIRENYYPDGEDAYLMQKTL